MVAQKEQTYRDVIKKYSYNVQTKNTLILTTAFNNLPLKIKTRISDLWEMKQTIKYNSTLDLLKNVKFNRKHNNLLNDIFKHIKLSPKLYASYISWYLLNEKVKAPFMNFLVWDKDDSIQVEFFRTPSTYDMKMATAYVRYYFERKPNIQKCKMDPRLIKTLQRKITSTFFENGYDALDKIYGEEFDDDMHKLGVLRTDKVRIKKHTKKINDTTF